MQCKIFKYEIKNVICWYFMQCNLLIEELPRARNWFANQPLNVSVSDNKYNSNYQFSTRYKVINCISVQNIHNTSSQYIPQNVLNWLKKNSSIAND